MRSIKDIKVFENIPILVRTALNVPIENSRVVNDYRLRRALPTIKYLSERGARVILISHLGEMGTETLKPVSEALKVLVPGVAFFDETVGIRARKAVRDLSPGNILVMENLRRNRGERSNDKNFARELSDLADIFIQDSFDTSHRLHASIVGVPKILPSYSGLLLEEEIDELTRALKPKGPSLAVIGGAKFNTKEKVLTTLLKTYDHVFVGGALANDFLKASGEEVGKSLVSETANVADIKKLLSNPKLLIPIDSVIDNEKILDHGLGTVALLSELAKNAKTILWNGPLGKYEDGFRNATDSLARATADSSAHSVVGGGDTIAAIEGLGLLPRFSFVSTGGGAMLEFLAHGTLPGIDALR
jgi:phosphoglycerate kinase